LPSRRRNMDDKQEIITSIQSGDLEKTRQLLAKDAKLALARDSSGVSAVMHALYRQRKDMLNNVLLSIKPDLDIFESASLGHTDRISELIGNDPALVNAWSGDGFTPLHLEIGRASCRESEAISVERLR